MNSVFDYICLRKPKLDYISPPICCDFSGSGFPTIVLDPFGRLLAPSGLILSGDGNLTLSWDPYFGALCYNIYQAVDADNPDGEYVIIAECIDPNTFQLPGPGPYRISAITPEGESELTPPIIVPGVVPPPVSVWDGLIAYWAWENNLTDLTGNTHDLYEIPPVAFAAGKINIGGSTMAQGDGRYGQDDQVFDFSGVASSIFTFAGWYNASEVSATHLTNIFAFGNYAIAADDLNFTFNLLDDGTYGGLNYSLVVPGVLANAWFFVVAHYNGVDKSAYLEINRFNKTFLPPGSVSLIATPGSSVFLGNHTGAFTPAATAYVDEYGLWPRELSNSELDYLYNSGVGKTFNT